LIDVSDGTDGAIVAVRVIPRAKRNGIDGERGGALLVRITAAPVEGAANDAVLALLSEQLRLPARALKIVSGAHSRIKRVAVSGLDAAALRQKLSAILTRQ
jgi:uncharacterized protein (TIGR00251 family)